MRPNRVGPMLLIVILLTGALAVRNRAAEPAPVWTVPTEKELADALGRIDDLPVEQRRAFSPKGHEVKRPPGPGDWLASYPEQGQSYTDFVASKPNRIDPTRRKLYIQPLGKFNDEQRPVLRQVADFGERFFRLKAELQPEIEIPETMTKRRNRSTRAGQILSTDVLDFLKADLPKDAYCRIAVTMTDLYPEPSWNYVFGQASLRDRVGVYSFARYDRRFFGEQPLPGDDLLFLRRCLGVFSHEVGHMFGIAHCTHYECLMNGSNNLEESDSQSPHLCPICLRKLAYAAGFDPAARYESLGKFYDRHFLTDEARWVRSRLLWVKEGMEPAAAAGS